MYFWLLCLYVVFVRVKCIWYLIDVTSNNCHIETFTSYEPFFVVLWEFHGYSLTDVSKMKFDWSILKCSIVIVLQYYLVHSLKMKRDRLNFLLLKRNSHLKSSILHFITFMILCSIIKPYNSFFVINCHIARQDFILNDQFSGGRNPGKILKFLRPLHWRHTNRK
jgi:hypothetical protein